jgi:hypothetical protein
MTREQLSERLFFLALTATVVSALMLLFLCIKTVAKELP